MLVINGWVLLAASVLNTLIGTMLADLTLRENGCPEGFSQLLLAVTLAFLNRAGFSGEWFV